MSEAKDLTGDKEQISSEGPHTIPTAEELEKDYILFAGCGGYAWNFTGKSWQKIARCEEIGRLLNSYYLQ